MDEDHVDAPVTQVVLVLDVAVVGQEEVDARLVGVLAKLLVHVAEGLGGWKADQKVGMLLPGCQDPHPTSLENGLARKYEFLIIRLWGLLHTWCSCA